VSDPPSAGPRAKMGPVEVPSAITLIEQVRSLPAAGPLLSHIGSAEGVYLVGGAVRDLLLGGEPGDLDLMVDGDPVAIANRLGEPRVHDRFGTCTVHNGPFIYDLARARTEHYSRPGALPDVAADGVHEDLKRRDFTVNAMAIALDGERPGELIAVPLALEDLRGRMLRVLHPGSFIDDPTRLLRLVRYATRLGFGIEPETRKLAAAAVGDGALETVSGARIGAELRLLAREPDPVAALAGLGSVGLDTAIQPAFGVSDRALAERALAMLPKDGRRDDLALGLAASRVPADVLSALLERLAFEAHDRDLIVALTADAQPLAEALGNAQRPSEIAAAVGGAGPELVALAGALGPEDRARRWLDVLRHVHLEIDGTDLLAAGIPRGPAVGCGLRAALAAKLDGAAPTRASELA
jgi:tRNA nucleotidyltransferase (CCA-adding enzyme)